MEPSILRESASTGTINLDTAYHVLQYSKEPPTHPGWYWYKDHHNRERVQQVIADPLCAERMTVLEDTFCGWQYKSIVGMGRQWAGPIEHPQSIQEA